MTAYTDIADLPKKHYAFVLEDPSWKFKSYALPKPDQKGRRDTERHYPTMTLDEIKAMPVTEVCARDCWLALWCTWPFLEHGLAVLKARGFKYSSSLFVWFKMKKKFSATREFITLPRDMHIGTGHTSRKNTEFVLLGRRGSPRVMAHDVHEPIFAPVREHSRKPDEQYARIERFARGPFLELNARVERENWDSWGNQIGLFPPVHPAKPSLWMPPVEPGLFDPPKPRWFSVEAGADEPEAPDEVEIPAFLKRMTAR